ncbi:urease accessory protein [Eubacterium aggregans]|uniref:Urease accessory protein UreE n=1 Tax=Eubacterium aggregans TaxID=81409 RepID=A0A1H3WV13_9FIRM|nr:urease accessory protein UreE [Eubacterium aggregans]SDZ90810.1 urease accessory protein [Eubacterium aggregans]
MLCEKILGQMEDAAYAGKTVDTVAIHWDEAFKKIHRKVSAAGVEVGIRLDDHILHRGLRSGDVLYADEAGILVVDIPPAEAIVFSVVPNHPEMLAKACYEVGNRHATLFYGESPDTFITPYTAPMMKLLSSLHSLTVEITQMRFNFDKRLSESINGHSH